MSEVAALEQKRGVGAVAALAGDAVGVAQRVKSEALGVGTVFDAGSAPDERGEVDTHVDVDPVDREQRIDEAVEAKMAR